MLLRVFIILDSRGSAVAPRYAVRKNRSGYPAPCEPLCWASPCFVRPSNVYRVNSLLLCVLPRVASVNWWISDWPQPPTSEQLTMQLLTPPPFVNSSDPASRPDGAAALDRCEGGRRARTARPLHWEAKPGFWSAGETPR